MTSSRQQDSSSRPCREPNGEEILDFYDVMLEIIDASC